ncbi:molybdopterin-synthase adenylyltransferase MoeB [Luteimonas sp. e5]
MQPRRISPRQAWQRVCEGARLIDIRDASERAAGMPQGARALAQDELLEDAGAHLPREGELLILCQRGVRSLALAQRLLEQGYVDVASVEGGAQAWADADLPMEESTLPADFLDRYSRQMRLPDVGIEGQQRLAAARVMLVGAGGLGSPAAFYLAAAGVGQLRVVDDDSVERSNLHRQILHTDAAIGQAKVASARERLLALNPQIRIEAVQQRIEQDNIDALLADADVVIDGADNFRVRHLANDACLRLRKPLVYGAVERFRGQASVFDAGRQPGVSPCYRCLFPEAPVDAPNCAEAGVLGVVPGIIGLIQATEAIKLILDIGESLVGRLLQFDALAMRWREARLHADPDCPACGSAARR